LIEIKIDATESTNDYLKEMMRRLPVADGTLVSTDHQTKGKGQRGTVWHFERDKSLAISILKTFDSAQSIVPFQVQIRVSLAILSVLETLGVPNLMVKWPNDILSDGAKIAGILIENQYQGQLKSSVIGLGLNVNNDFLPNLPNATSLFLVTNKVREINQIKSLLYGQILASLSDLQANQLQNDVAQYESSLFRKDVSSRFMTLQGEVFEGKIRGVSDQGLLRIEDRTNQMRFFALKTIKFLD